MSVVASDSELWRPRRRRRATVAHSGDVDGLLWYIQWFALENQQSPFYVVNKVTLRGQNSSLKFCFPLELHTQLKTGLDLLPLKIWGL